MKLTIITVSFNSIALLEQTIESVLGTSFSSFEYVVVDGNSTDGSQKLLASYEDAFSKKSISYIWSSSPDHGIYDAMNKGLNIASGNYVFFLNCGDTFCNSDSLNTIFLNANNVDLIYCYTRNILTSGERYVVETPFVLTHTLMIRGMPICHQGIIVKRELCPRYDTSYKIMADYDWIMRILLKKPTQYRYQDALTAYLIGGVSAKQFSDRWKDRWKLITRYFGAKGVLINVPFYIYDYSYWHFNLFRFLIEKKRKYS